MELTVHALAEDQPGPKWRGVYDRSWDAYHRWFLSGGNRARPTYLASLRALKAHMPELVPTFERLCDVAGGGDVQARFLSMWCPPSYVGGCSQAILPGRTGCLIRNYDFSPSLTEGTWLASRFDGRRVVAMVDSLWGVLDGINQDGLCASLAFGGRAVSGEGFGIPIVLRYVLEYAASTRDAVAILKRIPVHMAYTIALLDRSGAHATVYLGPDRPAAVVARLYSTNHQRRVEWPQHARASGTVERARALKSVVKTAAKAPAVLKAFLEPPVYQTAYGSGYGTLYTAVYRPEAGSAELIWPDERWTQSCDAFEDGTRTIRLG